MPQFHAISFPSRNEAAILAVRQDRDEILREDLLQAIERVSETERVFVKDWVEGQRGRVDCVDLSGIPTCLIGRLSFEGECDSIASNSPVSRGRLNQVQVCDKLHHE